MLVWENLEVLAGRLQRVSCPWLLDLQLWGVETRQRTVEGCCIEVSCPLNQFDSHGSERRGQCSVRVVGPHGQGRGRGPCLVGRAGLVMTLLWAIAVRIAKMGRAGFMQCPPCQVMKFAS